MSFDPSWSLERRKQQPTRVSASAAVSITQSMGRLNYAAANSTFSISVASSAPAFELLTRFEVSENRQDVIQVTSPPFEMY